MDSLWWTIGAQGAGVFENDSTINAQKNADTDGGEGLPLPKIPKHSNVFPELLKKHVQPSGSGGPRPAHQSDLTHQ